MKYIRQRSGIWYYRRRIPSAISNLSDINIIYRPLSRDKTMAIQMASRYNYIFEMIDIGIKMDNDVSKLVGDLNIRREQKRQDIYEHYIGSLSTSPGRLAKIQRLLGTIKVFMPSVEGIDMTRLDEVKSKLMRLPKGNIQKYKNIPKKKLVTMEFEEHEKLTTETINDYIKTLNALLRFAYERDYIPKPYQVKTLTGTTVAREQRQELSITDVRKLINSSRTDKLRSAYMILFYSGMRPSEAYKCKVTTVDGVRCFDLTDRTLELKTAHSHRLIPVHPDINEPERMLEDLRSMSSQYLGRQLQSMVDGVLYGLRHSFANELNRAGVEMDTITELMGHAHQGMTAGRYVKGYPVDVLHRAVKSLPSVHA